MPWLDRSGRFSPFKTAVFVALFAPAAWTLGELLSGALGTRPVMEVVRAMGLWTIRLLFVSLAITPLRRALDWPRLIQVRRMVGVAAFAYLVAHFLGYVVDQRLDLAKVASEIALRFYLTLGFGGLMILAALAATSTDAMLRRLGGRDWRRLHRWVYVAGTIASVHFFMQSKFDVGQPLWMAGLYVWMMAWRVAAPLAKGSWATLGILFGLALLAWAAAACGEAAYIWFKIGADPLRVLAANLWFDTGLRPSAISGGVALAVALAAALRRAFPLARRRLQSA